MLLKGKSSALTDDTWALTNMIKALYRAHYPQISHTKERRLRIPKLGKEVGKGFLTITLHQLWDRDRDEPGRRSATGHHRRPRYQVRPQWKLE